VPWNEEAQLHSKPEESKAELNTVIEEHPVFNCTIPQSILKTYSELLRYYDNRKDWKSLREDELWHSLCLCILSSNVPYEMAESAFTHLRKKELLGYDTMSENDFARRISAELATPICLPMRRNGSLRKYRFPNTRAKHIVEAARYLYFEKSGLRSILSSFHSDTEARDYLAAYVPGIGLKEASNFLRNVKYSDSLAIVDTHIMSFLKEVSLLPDIGRGAMTRKKYIMVETALRQICTNMGFNLSILDLAIWQCMRSK